MILPWHINRAQNVTHSENRRTTGETAEEKKRICVVDTEVKQRKAVDF